MRFCPLECRHDLFTNICAAPIQWCSKNYPWKKFNLLTLFKLFVILDCVVFTTLYIFIFVVENIAIPCSKTQWSIRGCRDRLSNINTSIWSWKCENIGIVRVVWIKQLWVAARCTISTQLWFTAGRQNRERLLLWNIQCVAIPGWHSIIHGLHISRASTSGCHYEWSSETA